MGRWVTSWEVHCVTPSIFFTYEEVRVRVHLSVNGGEDWVTSEDDGAMFAFVPYADVLKIEPDFGPQQGGTPVLVTLPYYYGSVNVPTACCFMFETKTILVTTIRLTKQTYRCVSPPWLSAPAVTKLGMVQSDGACDADPQTTYSFSSVIDRPCKLFMTYNIFPQLI